MEGRITRLMKGQEFKTNDNKTIRIENFWCLGHDIKEVITFTKETGKSTRVTYDDFMLWIEKKVLTLK